MREIEIKAHASDWEYTYSQISSLLGEGRKVEKSDIYLLNDCGIMMRVRNNNGKIESTVKKTSKSPSGDENNLEYEVHFSDKDIDEIETFFHVLGFGPYFKKYKHGYEWNYQSVHIELLDVNDLGWFLEMECLVPFDTSEDVIDTKRIHLHSLLERFGIKEESIEPRSYRSMILEG